MKKTILSFVAFLILSTTANAKRITSGKNSIVLTRAQIAYLHSLRSISIDEVLNSGLDQRNTDFGYNILLILHIIK